MGSAVVVLGAMSLLAGCGGDEQAAAPVKAKPRAPVAPPPPPPPAVTPVADLMAQLSIDERVLLSEDKAPENDVDRRAVLEFFDAFVRGDDETVGRMLAPLDKRELDALVKTGVWSETVADISECELVAGKGPYDEKCVIALYAVGTEFQPQMWYYTTDSDDVRFEAVATPPGVTNLLASTDWIRAWHELLEEERKLANMLDVELDQDQVVLEGESDPGSASRGAPSRPPSAPGFSPGPGGSPDRRPPGKKRKPPGAR